MSKVLNNKLHQLRDAIANNDKKQIFCLRLVINQLLIVKGKILLIGVYESNTGEQFHQLELVSPNEELNEELNIDRVISNGNYNNELNAKFIRWI